MIWQCIVVPLTTKEESFWNLYAQRIRIHARNKTSGLLVEIDVFHKTWYTFHLFAVIGIERDTYSILLECDWASEIIIASFDLIRPVDRTYDAGVKVFRQHGLWYVPISSSNANYSSSTNRYASNLLPTFLSPRRSHPSFDTSFFKAAFTSVRMRLSEQGSPSAHLDIYT